MCLHFFRITRDDPQNLPGQNSWLAWHVFRILCHHKEASILPTSVYTSFALLAMTIKTRKGITGVLKLFSYHQTNSKWKDKFFFLQDPRPWRRGQVLDDVAHVLTPVEQTSIGSGSLVLLPMPKIMLMTTLYVPRVFWRTQLINRLLRR